MQDVKRERKVEKSEKKRTAKMEKEKQRAAKGSNGVHNSVPSDGIAENRDGYGEAEYIAIVSGWGGTMSSSSRPSSS